MSSVRPWSTIVLVLAMTLTGCFGGDDDNPTDPGGGGGGDTTAPVVLTVTPRDGAISISPSQSITVVFSEDMDTTSDDGEISLSHENASLAATWSDDRTLVIAHDPFPEATEITLTLGTGIADVAGNTLAAESSTSFFTESSALVLLATTPADGATGVDRNANVVLRFSDSMNEATLASFITLDDGQPARAAIDFTLSVGSEDEIILNPTNTLPENTEISVNVAQGAQALGGAATQQSYDFSFTTGSTADTTPPTLVSLTPANGSTIPASTNTLVLEFSEALDFDSLEPNAFSGQFAFLLEAFDLEPTWSPDGTTLTLPLPTPLPDGLPLLVDFPPFRDQAGNESVEGFTYRLTVEGEANPYPLVDGVVHYFEGESSRTDSEGTQNSEYEDAIRFEEQDDLKVRRVTYSPDFLETYGYDALYRNGNIVEFHGFGDYDEGDLTSEIEFSPPVPWLDLPLSVGKTWSGSTTATEDSTVVTVQYTIEVVGKSDLVAQVGNESGPGETLIWADTWAVVLDYDFVVDGETFQSGTDSTYYAAGVGPVRSYSFEEDFMEDRTSESTEVLTGIDLGIE